MRHTERSLETERLLYFQLKIVHTLVWRTDFKGTGVDMEKHLRSYDNLGEKVSVGDGASDGNKEAEYDFREV